MIFSRFRWHHFENQQKEKKNQYCLGKDYVLRESVNDDFESLLESISIGIEPENFAKTYFLPKLTEEEMKLVERKNPNYLKTFTIENSDVNEAEMNKSESDDKFCLSVCERKTFTFELSGHGSCRHKLQNRILEEPPAPKKSRGIDEPRPLTLSDLYDDLFD